MNPPSEDFAAAAARPSIHAPVRAACRLALAALKAPTLSPAGLLVWAMVFAAAWGMLEALGWRDSACVISGMSPTGNPADRLALAKGMLYVLVYFAGVLGAPILAIAAGLMAVMERLSGMRQTSNAAVNNGGPSMDKLGIVQEDPGERAQH